MTKPNDYDSGINDIIKDQILIVRDTGATNMFLFSNVKDIAETLGLNELADFLTERKNREKYFNFIMTGKR